MSQKNTYQPAYYGDYLKLDQLLSAQVLRSEAPGETPAHDEMLFIVIHQIYELWFKQVLHELNSILTLFKNPSVEERFLDIATARQHRMIEILKLVIDQVTIIETIQPMDFLDFRHLLIPASGFQSVQFRQLENSLGLRASHRLKYNDSEYQLALKKNHQELVQSVEAEPSLFDLMETWLERTPFLNFEGFDFWETYRETVETLFEQDLEMIQAQTQSSDDDKERQLKKLNQTQSEFQTLFSEEGYQGLLDEGHKRLSYQATKAALLIMLYKDQPILNGPYRFLMNVLTMDEQLTTWRYRHALMVQRIIGAKVGTGGSMGYQYLMQTLEKHKIFSDLAGLSTFLLPKSRLPELPPSLVRQLGYYFESKGAE